jgi:ketosteroid isomerase-like protein
MGAHREACAKPAMQTQERLVGIERRLEMALLESFIRAFNDTFLTDDIDGFMQLIDSDCEWVIMATGETFRGEGSVRQLAERSVAARKHTQDVHMDFTNLFSSEDQMCLEYAHRGIITEKWPSSLQAPPVGTLFDIKICLVCHVKDGKFDRIHEYFDLGQVVSPGTVRRLYS